jgi:hypothetical protein
LQLKLVISLEPARSASIVHTERSLDHASFFTRCR